MTCIQKLVRRTRVVAIFSLIVASIFVPSQGSARDAGLAFSLRDGPIPDGLADDLILPPDTNYGRVFLSQLFDAEFYVEFIATDGSFVADANLAVTLIASDFDLIYGESKTFRISAYEGGGVAELETFGSGTLIETVTLPSNGEFLVDVNVTDLWNDAVARGDDFFGIRIHDPFWTGTIVGAGVIDVTGVVLEGVPEPASGPLLAAGILLLSRLAAGRRAHRHAVARS